MNFLLNSSLRSKSLLLGSVVLSHRLFSINNKISCEKIINNNHNVYNNKLKIGLCQIHVGKDKQINIEKAKSAILEAKIKGADLVVLPEIWNSPYSTSSFPKYAEIIPEINSKIDEKLSPSTYMLSEIAKQNNIYIVGGSIPEKFINNNNKENIYNTCVILNSKGEIIGKHRKIHLFDIDIPNKIKFKESDTLTAGNNVTTILTPWGKIGIGICYDLRFPELATIMRQLNCDLLIYPGAFNMTTGPLHWDLLQRARAVDNNVFVATCSPARIDLNNPINKNYNGYIAYGNSNIISPMGEILISAGTEENVIVYEINLQQAYDMREQIPCWKQKRFDLYETINKK